LTTFVRMPFSVRPHTFLRQILTGLIVLMLGSCSINPSIMFKGEHFAKTEHDSLFKDSAIRITQGDLLSISVFSDNGVQLIADRSQVNLIESAQANLNTASSQTGYLVDDDGLVRLPIIGLCKIGGLTIREAENKLIDNYKSYYTNPFVILKVINQRVLVFPGTGGSGKVVPIENTKTSLIEVLAAAGGITNTGKANQIKIIRQSKNPPQVFVVSLEHMNSAIQNNILVQPNDIIYVDPVPRKAQETLILLAPYFGIITSLAILYQIANSFQ